MNAEATRSVAAATKRSRADNRGERDFDILMFLKTKEKTKEGREGRIEDGFFFLF
jgi:hypothetical protein